MNIMKLKLFLYFTTFLVGIQTYAQTGVAINTTGNEPDNSAILDVSSTEKGILIPRMTEAQRTDIVSPATGLLVFQADEKEGFYYYDGSAWKRLDTGSISGITSTSPIVISGGTAPVISISEATISGSGSMSAADKTKLDGIASGAEVNVNADWNATSGDSKILNKPTGTSPGQMLYWDGTAWLNVASGLNGQVFKYVHGVPTWCDGNIDDLVIGDAYKGGIIAYFLQSGDPGHDSEVQHGLIVTPDDIGTAQWGCNGMLIGTTSFSFGFGAANTQAIVDSCSEAGRAARLCYDLVMNGYDDWYLPSWEELYRISINKDVIGGFHNSAYYWTSSEYSQLNGREVRMGYSNHYYYSKVGTDWVRPVRSF